MERIILHGKVSSVSPRSTILGTFLSPFQRKTTHSSQITALFPGGSLLAVFCLASTLRMVIKDGIDAGRRPHERRLSNQSLVLLALVILIHNFPQQTARLFFFLSQCARLNLMMICQTGRRWILSKRNVGKSASTSSKTSASYVSSSLTTRVSLVSLSDKSTVDMVKNTNVDYATGSFCSSCSIPPCVAGGLWCDGEGCAMCHYDDNCGGL